MRILAIEKAPAQPAPFTAALLRAEAEAVWRLQQGDVFREIWFTTRDRRAVVLLECADEAAAQATLAQLPLVQAGCIDFELHPLRAYDGLARLFAAPS